MWKVGFSLGLVVVWALVGWSQCVEVPCLSFDGPSVAFKLCVQVAGGTCSNVPKTPPAPSDTVRCSVSEGASGTVDLIVNRTAPVGFTGAIVLTGSIPGGWPTFTPVSKSGSGNMSLTAQYRFTVPPGTAGRTFELKFKAVADGCYGELVLTVILDVAARTSEPQIFGPFTGTTDDAGKFTVSIPGLPNNVRVGGTLTECTVKVLARTSVTLYVAARAMTFGSGGFQWAAYSMPPVVQQASPVDYVLISSPGFPQMKVTPVRIIPIIVGGTTYTMVDLGTVSFPSPTCLTQPRDGAITGTTDHEGRFTTNVGSGTTVSGRLTQCTVTPLPNQTFTVVPKFSGGELDALTFLVPGYADTTVTKAVSVVHLGSQLMINIGDVCLQPAPPPPPCDCTNLIIEVGTPTITGWIHTIEIWGGVWVQADVSLPVTWTIACGPERPPDRCTASIRVKAAAGFDPSGFVPGPGQTRLWTQTIRCSGNCPGETQRFEPKYVRFSFLLKAKDVMGFPFAEVLPYKGVITLTLTPVCPGAVAPLLPAVVQIPVGIGLPGGGAPPNPNPPPPLPPLPPSVLPGAPSIACDPYVAEIESVDPLPGAALVSVRIGNQGAQAASGDLVVTVLLEDGSESVGSLSGLSLPANMEFTVQIVLQIPPPSDPRVWPPASAVVAELIADGCDDNPDNNRAEWP